MDWSAIVAFGTSSVIIHRQRQISKNTASAHHSRCWLSFLCRVASRLQSSVLHALLHRHRRGDAARSGSRSGAAVQSPAARSAGHGAATPPAAAPAPGAITRSCRPPGPL